jgi:uncharacterized membrane protein
MRREMFREYVAGALWVLPGFCGLVAILTGYLLALVDVPADSALAFQGTADDARALLAGISGTVVTVIALVLGLTVVALQLSSTQFSPRLLRNFLRDRPNQVVLGVFVATFAYSTAGLFTVGLSSGQRSEDYPRLAITGALVLLFASLAMVVYFADHLAHSIQVDSIMARVERTVLRVMAHEARDDIAGPAPRRPEWALALPAARSGYVQTAHPELLLPAVAHRGLTLSLHRRVGEHVVAGTTLAWVWAGTPQDTPTDPRHLARLVSRAVRIGFERTFEQDIGFGVRQLVDVACKALSPGINDPYTAIQSIDHLAVIFCRLAVRPIGGHVLHRGDGVVSLPGRSFDDLLATTCGLIRRYGCSEPTVMMRLVRLLGACAEVLTDGRDHRAAIEREATLILQDVERAVRQPADTVLVRGAVHDLRAMLG